MGDSSYTRIEASLFLQILFEFYHIHRIFPFLDFRLNRTSQWNSPSLLDSHFDQRILCCNSAYYRFVVPLQTLLPWFFPCWSGYAMVYFHPLWLPTLFSRILKDRPFSTLASQIPFPLFTDSRILSWARISAKSPSVVLKFISLFMILCLDLIPYRGFSWRNTPVGPYEVLDTVYDLANQLKVCPKLA